jgi:hypothetical protein
MVQRLKPAVGRTAPKEGIRLMDEGDKPITTAELLELRDQMLEAADRAIAGDPALYRQIRRMLCKVVHGDVEIGDYYSLALNIARSLDKLGPGVFLFEYYSENIHPEKKGKARFFRPECQDLLFQLDSIQEFKRKKRPFKIINGGKGDEGDASPPVWLHNG